MAIIVETNNPGKLVRSLYSRIDIKSITTWIADGEGDITISNPMWRYRAWFRLKEKDNSVVFGLVPSTKYTMTKELYGVFHGRLAATLLANFDDLINSIELTAGYYVDYDVIPTS